MKYLFKKQIVVFTVLVAFVFILSCNKYKNSVAKEQYLDDEIPVYDSTSSEELNAEIHLGRVLFYDKNLSVNNSVSCASCHKQEFAFADNAAFSTGFENRLTTRNSIAIQNLSLFNFFGELVLFWDGREMSLTSLISRPIANHVEMGMDNEQQLLDKLNKLPYMQQLAQKAFGAEKISNMDLITVSMARYLSFISSKNSKFDLSSTPPHTVTFNALEQKGAMLFSTTYQCNNCHKPTPGVYNGLGAGFANIGLEVNSTDKGLMNISGNITDEGKFKVPDLHNVAITAPYMHDGRFKTLNDVLEHYSHGIQNNIYLDERLRNLDETPKQLNITEDDKAALIAFLSTMTDYTVFSNPLFSNPFKYR